MPPDPAPAPAPAPTPAPAPSNTPWYAPLNLEPEAVKFVEDRKFDGANTLIKSAIESDRVARARNVLDKPDLSKVLEWKGFEELGWSSDRAKYKIDLPKQENGKPHEVDAGFLEAFSTAAHGAKALPAQAAPILKAIIEFGQKSVADREAKGVAEVKELETRLRAEWPGTIYDEKKTLAERAMKFAGLGARDSKLLDQALGSPGLVKLFAQFGEAIGEDKLAGGGGGGGFGGGEGLAAIEAEKRAFMSDPAKVKALRDASVRNHQDVAAEWAKIGEREAKARQRQSRAA